MTSTQTTQTPEGADQLEDHDIGESAESLHVVDSDHEIAAEAARRQARQDPLQG